MKNFKKGLSNEGYAKHTPTPRKPGYRFTWIPHKARFRFCAIPLYVIKGRNPL